MYLPHLCKRGSEARIGLRAGVELLVNLVAGTLVAGALTLEVGAERGLPVLTAEPVGSVALGDLLHALPVDVACGCGE